jgi:hypothetical protein
MGKSTISMVIFSSYVKLPEGTKSRSTKFTPPKVPKVSDRRRNCPSWGPSSEFPWLRPN